MITVDVKQKDEIVKSVVMMENGFHATTFHVFLSAEHRRKLVAAKAFDIHGRFSLALGEGDPGDEPVDPEVKDEFFTIKSIVMMDEGNDHLLFLWKFCPSDDYLCIVAVRFPTLLSMSKSTTVWESKR